MHWDWLDYLVAFTVMGAMAGLLAIFIVKSRDVFYRLGGAAAVLTAFVLIWSNLAVGIVGEPNNPINLLYFGTLVFGAAGATVARLEARGMAVTMFAVSLAQCVCIVLALATRAGDYLMPSVIVTAFLSAGFSTSAWLFLQAARPAQVLNHPR
ncbi:MAG: hypothetical protein QM759_17470 [Terricaulis sp.]